MAVRPYESTRALFLEDMLPLLLQHMDESGNLMDADNCPVRTGTENPYNQGLLLFYDGEKLLSNVYSLLTRKKQELPGFTGVKGESEYKDHFREHGYGDVTRFLDSHKGRIVTAVGALINSYGDVSEDELIEQGLPDDNRAPNGSISKYDSGTRTGIALVVTKANENVGSVLLTCTHYELGGKVQHIVDGAVSEECFARYNPLENVVEIVDRKYKQGENGLELDGPEKVTEFACATKPEPVSKSEFDCMQIPASIDAMHLYCKEDLSAQASGFL